MGLFRRKDERAIPKPGTPEFDQAVEGTALPDSASVSMGEPGWTEPHSEPKQPDQPPAAEQKVDESTERTRRGKVIGALGRTVLRPPNTDGFAGGIPAPQQDPDAKQEEPSAQQDTNEG